MRWQKPSEVNLAKVDPLADYIIQDNWGRNLIVKGSALSAWLAWLDDDKHGICRITQHITAKK